MNIKAEFRLKESAVLQYRSKQLFEFFDELECNYVVANFETTDLMKIIFKH